jgi:hypothetical protein
VAEQLLLLLGPLPTLKTAVPAGLVAHAAAEDLVAVGVVPASQKGGRLGAARGGCGRLWVLGAQRAQ